MEFIDKATARLLAELLRKYGVSDVVVSSGSRCAPMTATLVRSGYFALHPVIDERTAAFVALGIALASDRPVAMVCTSGSAMLNYAPALAEAYYRRVPLIAITADRPADIIDQRDSQTIRQVGALSAVVRKCVDIADDSSERNLTYANRLINDALNEATGGVPGPVHINMQFEAPLTPVTDSPRSLPAKKMNVLRAAVSDFSDIIDSIPVNARIIVALGGMHVSDADREIIARLDEQSAVAVYAEVQSNVARCNTAWGHISFAGLDEPDILITAGGSLVSRAFKTWIRGCKNVRHISLGYDDCAVDTFGHLSESVNCNPFDFLRAIATLGNHKFKEAWKEVVKQSFTKTIVVSSVIQKLAEAVPEAVFHVSNGSAIRYVQSVQFGACHRIESNRGVSGIEGASSTAIGDAMVNGRTTILITGDMSAAYDIGALAISGIPSTFKMVVLDNQGGDIFRMISTTKALPELEEYFAMPPRFPIEHLAAAYGFDYFEANVENVDVSNFLNSRRPSILRLILEPSDALNLIR